MKKEVVHWVMGKGDGTSLVSRKSRLVNKRQGKKSIEVWDLLPPNCKILLSMALTAR